MKVPHSEGVANHTVLESCVAYREVRREALTEVRIGQPLSRESVCIQGADVFALTEGNMGQSAIASSVSALRGLRPWHVRTLLVWEPGDLWPDHCWQYQAVARIGKARSRSR
ncbi:hypothetical protein JKG47_09075 [Acidithiobacillus sp. MC6.1]|nr:hypothetical protein [Acidithiobacillus sp. MC6.1]